MDSTLGHQKSTGRFSSGDDGVVSLGLVGRSRSCAKLGRL